MKLTIRSLVVLFSLLSIRIQSTPGISNAQLNGIAIQSDGFFVAVGSVMIEGTTQYLLSRYSPFGTIDLSYGQYGYIATPLGISSLANSLKLLSTNEAVVVGLAQIGSIEEFAIASYSSNGILDTSFNTTGIVTRSIGTGATWRWDGS